MPRRSSASAAVNPPMPPPTMTTFLGTLMKHSQVDFDQSSLAFHAGGLHHAGNSGLEAELLQAGDQFSRLQGFVDRGIELLDDGRPGCRPAPTRPPNIPATAHRFQALSWLELVADRSCAADWRWPAP